jgi:hypothetical protein
VRRKFVKIDNPMILRTWRRTGGPGQRADVKENGPSGDPVQPWRLSFLPGITGLVTHPGREPPFSQAIVRDADLTV